MRTQYIITVLVFMSVGMGCSDDNPQPAPTTSYDTMCPEGQQRNPISQKCVSIIKDMARDIATDLAGDMNTADQASTDMQPKMDMTNTPDIPDMMIDMSLVMETRRFVTIGDTVTGSSSSLMAIWSSHSMRHWGTTLCSNTREQS